MTFRIGFVEKGGWAGLKDKLRIYQRLTSRL